MGQISPISVPIIVAFALFGRGVVWKLFVTTRENLYFRQRHVISAIDEYSDMISFESINENSEFVRFTEAIEAMQRPPYIVFYDSSNINITLNHICNLKYIPDALSRLALISFDTTSHLIIRQKHPNIPSVLIDLDPVKDAIEEGRENRKYIIYQLVLLTRARVCAVLAYRSIDFWAMQQDTIWIENFDSMQLEDRYPNHYMLFDTVGNDQVDTIMRSRLSPDSSIMTYLCGHKHYRCKKLPKWIISSSNYFMSERESVPVLIQVDSDQQKETKMEMFRRANFLFRHDNGTCDRNAVLKLRDSVRIAFPEEIRPSTYIESPLVRLHYTIKRIFNIDPLNNKVFMTVHETLV